jgi:signal transduction histidine kinase
MICPPEMAAHQDGTGLPSMTERAHAVGGSLEAGRCGTGWRVRAVLPTGGGRP